MKKLRRAEAYWSENQNRWQINIQNNGVRKSFYSSDPSKRGKRAVEEKAENWLDHGTRENMRLYDALDNYIDYKSKIVGNATARNIRGFVSVNIKNNIQNKKLCTVNAIDWQNCIRCAEGRNLSVETLKSIRKNIFAFLEFCEMSDYDYRPVKRSSLTISKSAKPKKPKSSLSPDAIRTVFTDDSFLVYNKPAHAWYIHAWRFFIATGLRRGELVGLKKSDIQNGYITVSRSINKLHEETHGKTENARRTFAINPTMQKILNDQFEMLQAHGIKSKWIFPNKNGEVSNPNLIYDHWTKYCDFHNFKASIHELRHTFISINKADMPLELMKRIVGHSVNMDTFGIYGHTVEGDLERASEIAQKRMDEILT